MTMKELRDAIKSIRMGIVDTVTVTYYEDNGVEMLLLRGVSKDGYYVDLTYKESDIFLDQYSAYEVAETMNEELLSVISQDAEDMYLKTNPTIH